MSVLENYFGYFSQYYGEEIKSWHGELTKWTGIAIKIKSKVLEDSITESETEEKICNIISENSNDELKSIEDFFERFLFKQDNGLGYIGQGVVWDTDSHPDKTAIKEKLNVELFVKLLQEKDIKNVKKSLDDLHVGRSYETAKIRFLRALFPDFVAAVDAPNKLNWLISSIRTKLDITIEL